MSLFVYFSFPLGDGRKRTWIDFNNFDPANLLFRSKL